MIPETIAHYRIIKKIGSGGMGEVFQAQDTRLERLVALKIIPPGMASDPARMKRFQQEAKAASMLSHPNVAHIYEIGESDGIHFIAMECIEGETLQEAMKATPVSAERVLDWGEQIADTLCEAHSRGLIHRDLKPSNLMITPRGQIKILDFGLARLDPVEPDFKEASTLLKTETGMIVGTIHYMSPEQALGQKVDARSDLFSLGVLLYELAAGRRPFSGATAAATIDAILHHTPDPLTRWNYEFPVELQAAIFKCLRKNAEERYQSARDLLSDLRVLKARDPQSASFPIRQDYKLPRNVARALFSLLQIMYLCMYVSALRWSEGLFNGLEAVLPGPLPEIVLKLLLFTALPGMAARLYFISMNTMDHVQTGVQFRKAFPFIFLIDVLWALSPFGLSLLMNPLLALACIPPLVFSPFSQRTLVSSAYNTKAGGRIA